MTLLDELIGQSLNAVVFIHDYLQLQFEAATVSLFAFPEVTRASRVARFGDPVYRNELCDFIGRTVTHLDVNGDSEVEIVFGEDRMKLEHLANSPEDAVFIFKGGRNVVL